MPPADYIAKSESTRFTLCEGPFFLKGHLGPTQGVLGVPADIPGRYKKNHTELFRALNRTNAFSSVFYN